MNLDGGKGNSNANEKTRAFLQKRQASPRPLIVLQEAAPHGTEAIYYAVTEGGMCTCTGSNFFQEEAGIFHAIIPFLMTKHPLTGKAIYRTVCQMAELRRRRRSSRFIIQTGLPEKAGFPILQMMPNH
jgi:hypothetical protein